MRMHVHIAVPAFMLWAAGLSSAADTQYAVLDGLKRAFTEAHERIEKDRAATKTGLLARYEALLSGLRQQAQQSGSLDDMLAADREMKRFAADRTVPTELETGLARIIVSARSQYHRQMKTAELGGNGSLVELANQYKQRLEKFRKELVIRNNIDYALKVDAELKRIEADPEISAAAFALADAGGNPAAVRKRQPLPPSIRQTAVLHYTFDNPAEDGVADSAGRNRGRVHYAGRTQYGILGDALVFNEEDDSETFVETADSTALNPPSRLAVSAWVKPARHGNESTVIDKHSGQKGYVLLVRNGKPEFAVSTGAGWHAVADNSDIAVEAWTHLAGVFTGTALKLYVNGRETASKTVHDASLGKGKRHELGSMPLSKNAVHADVPLVIGHAASDRNSGTSFHGAIDEVMIFNAMIPPESVQWLYNAGADPQ